MSEHKTVANMSDDELIEEYLKWIDRANIATKEFSYGLAIGMVDLIEKQMEKRGLGQSLDPMRGVEFPFAENH